MSEREDELVGPSAGAGTREKVSDDATADGDVPPYQLLQEALRAMCDAGLLQPRELELAALSAWAAVHGLAELLLGPLAGLPDQGRTQIIETALDFITRGVIST